MCQRKVPRAGSGRTEETEFCVYMFSEKMLLCALDECGETPWQRGPADSFEIVTGERIEGIVFTEADNIPSVGGKAWHAQEIMLMERTRPMTGAWEVEQKSMKQLDSEQPRQGWVGDAEMSQMPREEVLRRKFFINFLLLTVKCPRRSEKKRTEKRALVSLQ